MKRRASPASPTQRASNRRRAEWRFEARIGRPALSLPSLWTETPDEVRATSERNEALAARTQHEEERPSRPSRPSRMAALVAILFSLALHGGLVAIAGVGAHESTEQQIEIDVSDTSLDGPGKPAGAVAGDRAHGEERLTPGGATSAQNVDARNAGDCGDGVGPQAVLLVTHADSVRLQDSPMDAVGVAQVQRIDTARDRASREDRRATPHPARDPFLASGDGTHRERRDPASVDPRAGAVIAPHATERGEANQGVEQESEPLSSATDPQDPRDRGSRVGEAGRDVASPGTGIQGGAGSRESSAARVATGRPPVDEGPAATLTELRDPRVRDDARSELLATRSEQSWVEASEHGGAHEGSGVGGIGGGGAAGSGGAQGEGGHARAFGPGGGDYDSLDTSDARYQRWFLDQTARVDRHLVFPRARMLSMDQGISVYRIIVNRDGTVRGVPELIHSSGFDDLDRAALVALLQSFPFGAVPDAVMGNHATLRLVMPIKFSNPMVH